MPRGEPRGAPAAGGAVTTELDVATIDAGFKHFFVTFCENRYGQFLKVTEVGKSGSKAKVLVPAVSFHRLVQMLDEMVMFEAGLEPVVPSAADEEDKQEPSKTPGVVLHELRMKVDGKVLFLDLKQNFRGRLLKISTNTHVGEQRASVVLPIDAVPQFRGHIARLIDKYLKPSSSSRASTPASAAAAAAAAAAAVSMPAPAATTAPGPVVARTEIRIGGKRILLDGGQNDRGAFLRIMESVGDQRSWVTVPSTAWKALYDAIGQHIAAAPADVLNSGSDAPVIVSHPH